mgnify:CR=1 FL=1|tara:strand:+ start:3513 stop:3986 length:474 start_codon:yes stop_codon:yes gene_type:complete
MSPKKINLKKYKDSRGYLIEILPKKFKKKFVYSILTNSKKNVVRGLHYDSRLEEEKLIYLLDGKILDVCVNLKKGKNFGKITYKTLKKGDGLYIPKGFAHGYKCLQKKNIIIYFLTKFFDYKTNKGIIWNDKKLKIKWRIKHPIISKKDLQLPELKK